MAAPASSITHATPALRARRLRRPLRPGTQEGGVDCGAVDRGVGGVVCLPYHRHDPGSELAAAPHPNPLPALWLPCLRRERGEGEWSSRKMCSDRSSDVRPRHSASPAAAVTAGYGREPGSRGARLAQTLELLIEREMTATVQRKPTVIPAFMDGIQASARGQRNGPLHLAATSPAALWIPGPSPGMTMRHPHKICTACGAKKPISMNTTPMAARPPAIQAM